MVKDLSADSPKKLGWKLQKDIQYQDDLSDCLLTNLFIKRTQLNCLQSVQSYFAWSTVKC